jgi:ArsR family transcriptional regulator
MCKRLLLAELSEINLPFPPTQGTQIIIIAMTFKPVLNLFLFYKLLTVHGLSFLLINKLVVYTSKMLEVRPLCVCEITEILNLASSTVSKHLSLLRNAELIISEKDGKWVNYYLNQDQNEEYVQQLIPLIKSWLPEDKIIFQDKEKVKTVDRNFICGN